MSTYIQLATGKTVIVDTMRSLEILENGGYQDLMADDAGFFMDHNPFCDTDIEPEKDVLEEIPDVEELEIEEINIKDELD